MTHNGGDAIYAGSKVEFTITATDNDSVAKRALTINGKSVTVNATTGKASYTFSAAGTYEVIATATDATGNEGTKTIIIVVTAKDTAAPVMNITSDARGTIYVGNTVEFTVTATDNVGVVSGPTFTINGETVALDANGKASYTFISAGSYELIATATDAAGNEGIRKVTITVAVDTTNPEVDLYHSGSDNMAVGDTVVFTVWMSDNDAVAGSSFTINGKAFEIGSDRKVSYTFTEAGTYEIIVTAWDAAGNKGQATATITVSVKDVTPPSVTITSTARETVYIGNTVEFTVMATDDVGVVGSPTFTINGKTVALDANGKASYTFDAAGSYEIIATAKDAAGLEGSSRVVITVVKDTTDPTINLSHNGSANMYVGETVEFTVTSSDNDGIAGSSLTVNGKAVELGADGKASITFTATGTYEVIAMVWDAAGNKSQATITITVTTKDTIPPTVTITSTARETVYIGNTVEFTVKATDNVGVVGAPTFTINGKAVTLDANGKASYTFAAAGSYEIIATAKDAAGLEGSSRVVITVVKDTTDPTISLSHNGSANMYVGETVEFTVTSSDNDGIAGSSLTVNGKAVELGADGKASITFTATGTYEVIAMVWDAAGNKSQATITITVTIKDTIPPTVTITSNARETVYIGNTVEFTVKATDNVGVVGAPTFTINGKAAALDANGKASYTFDAAGSYEIIATAKDAAGLEGSSRVVITVVKDTTDPTINLSHNGSANMYVGDTVEFTVTSSDNDGIAGSSLTVNGKAVELGANGKASITFTATGTYEVIATVWDAAGNKSQATITITVTIKDVTAPAVNITHNGGSVISTGQNVTFTVTANDEVGVVGKPTFTINDVAVELNDNNQVVHVFTAAGTYTIMATARDAAGNIGEKTITVTVEGKDLEAPTVTIEGYPGKVQVGEKVEFTVKATDNVGVAGMEVYIGDVKVDIDASGKVSHVFTAPGVYAIVAKAWDAAGNNRDTTVYITVTSSSVGDYEDPEVSITHNAPQELFVGTTVKFTVNATDNVGVVERTLTVDGIQVSLDDTFSGSFTFTSSGTYYVRATATDAAGNSATAKLWLTVSEAERDAEAPVVTLTHNAMAKVYVGQTITFWVSATDNVGVASLELTINGVKIAFDGDGKAEYTFTETGTYDVIAIAYDEAGNRDRQVVTLEVL